MYWLHLLKYLFQRWLNALTDHIGFATHFIHAGDSQEDAEVYSIASLEEALQVSKI